MSTDKRREGRYPARIVARIIRRGKRIDFLTNDVSFRGVFIRTDAPPALRQLVKVELVLPDDGIVSGHAMVVHIAPTREGQANDETVPGIGLQFWGPLAQSKQWEKFVQQLKAAAKAARADVAKPTDKVRRASERFKLNLEVVFDGKTTMTRDISEHGLAIRTDVPMPIGSRAQLGLRSGDELLTFDVLVKRAIDEPGFKGLGVEMVGIEPPKREELIRFVRKNAPSEDRIFIEIGDPKLH